MTLLSPGERVLPAARPLEPQAEQRLAPLLEPQAEQRLALPQEQRLAPLLALQPRA